MVSSFERDIRPLFRNSDRLEMDFAFDLRSYDEVKHHAQSILERIVDGTMPCDDPWPRARVELFRTWIVEGMPA